MALFSLLDVDWTFGWTFYSDTTVQKKLLLHYHRSEMFKCLGWHNNKGELFHMPSPNDTLHFNKEVLPRQGGSSHLIKFGYSTNNINNYLTNDTEGFRQRIVTIIQKIRVLSSYLIIISYHLFIY